MKLLSVIKNNLYMLKFVYRFCRMHLFVSIFMSLFGSVSPIINLYFTRFIINSIFSGKGSKIITDVIILISAMFIVNCIQIILSSYIQKRVIPKNVQVINKKMQIELLEKAMQVELMWYDDYEFYNKFSMAMQQSDSRALSVLNSLTSFIGSMFGVSALIVLISSFDPMLILFTIINVILTFCINHHIIKLQYQQKKEYLPLSRECEYTKRVLYLREYAKEIRLFSGLFNVLILKLTEATSKLINIIDKFGKKLFRLTCIQSTISTFINSGTMIYLSLKALSSKILVGDFVALTTGSQQLAGQITNLLSVIPSMFENSLYIEEFKRFVEFDSFIDLCTGTHINEIDNITMKSVSFSYPNTNKEVLHNIDFEVSRGERIAIVGKNGSGKSTLIKLIARLYDPSMGEIYVNDSEYQHCDIKSIRDNIGVIFQDYKEYAMSIAENVLMREIQNEEADRELVINALKFSGLYNKICNLPNGIYSKVTREFSNEGIFLSGGELQKLALARIYVKKCSLIILDEPSSSLDPISESEMFTSMKHLSMDKCTIMVSHRLVNIIDADRIYVMEKGEIVEVGSHKDLIECGGVYCEMYYKQNPDELSITQKS